MIRPKTRKDDTLHFPFLGYLGYGMSKFFDSFKSLSLFLDKAETMALSYFIRNTSIQEPLYIIGLARAGTTIVLEILSKHPELASHKYKHLIIPYLPHFISYIIDRTTLYQKPFERIHKDKMIVNRNSPEAVEEIFWRKYFDNISDETQSNILDSRVSNHKFERFYQNHIRKLLFNQKKPRYIAKNNYNVTRMEYLLKLFPDAKFFLVVRNPTNHLASLIKQTKLFTEMEQENRFLRDWLGILGHNEFGYPRVCINVDNSELIQEIHHLWRIRHTYVRGWALYWSSIYDYLANTLEKNKKLKKATLIIKYDDLCASPARIIDQMLEHAELPMDGFEKVKEYYVKHLHQPTYYSPSFSKQEYSEIAKLTNDTYARF